MSESENQSDTESSKTSEESSSKVSAPNLSECLVDEGSATPSKELSKELGETASAPEDLDTSKKPVEVSSSLPQLIEPVRSKSIQNAIDRAVTESAKAAQVIETQKKSEAPTPSPSPAPSPAPSPSAAKQRTSTSKSAKRSSKSKPESSKSKSRSPVSYDKLKDKIAYQDGIFQYNLSKKKSHLTCDGFNAWTSKRKGPIRSFFLDIDIKNLKEKEFVCTFCGYTNTTADDVEKHVKYYHFCKKEEQEARGNELKNVTKAYKPKKKKK